MVGAFFRPPAPCFVATMASDAAACAAVQEDGLPDGWTKGEKEVVIYEWRCPHGEVCGKGYKLLYKKDVEKDALTNGAWHLWDKHKDVFPTWVEAEAEALQGITENPIKVECLYDADMLDRLS